MTPWILNPSRFASSGGGGGSAAAYDASVITDSPWGFWKEDETSGTTLADSSGNSRPMSMPAGVPVFSQGDKWGGSSAIKWPDSAGATDYYAKTAVAFNTSAATLEAIFYFSGNPTNQTGLLCCGSSYGGGGVDKYLYLGTDGKPRFYIFNAGQLTLVGSALSVGWHHIAASVGAGGTRLRVDKVNVDTNANTGSTASGSAILFAHGGGADGTGGNAVNPTNSSEIVISRLSAYTTQLTTTQSDAHATAAGF